MKQLKPHTMYSQYGEDGIILTAVEAMGISNGYFVEFGAADGIIMSNTRCLAERGWPGLYIECDSNKFDQLQKNIKSFRGVRASLNRVTCDPDQTLDIILDDDGAPEVIDVLSIDIDGNDYWIWRGLRRRPKLIVIEYNSNFEPDDSKVMPYNPLHSWGDDTYYGASARALFELGEERGYTLVYGTMGNMIFICKEHAGLFKPFAVDRFKLSPIYSPSFKLMVDPKEGGPDA